MADNDNVIRLVSTRAEPMKRACGTCLHWGGASSNARCRATNNYMEYERHYDHYACGMDGNLWEARPPWPGLFKATWRFLFGN